MNLHEKCNKDPLIPGIPFHIRQDTQTGNIPGILYAHSGHPYMENFRSVSADRTAPTLVNMQVINKCHFDIQTEKQIIILVSAYFLRTAPEAGRAAAQELVKDVQQHPEKTETEQTAGPGDPRRSGSGRRFAQRGPAKDQELSRGAAFAK